jgi:hypothetical protein
MELDMDEIEQYQRPVCLGRVGPLSAAAAQATRLLWDRPGRKLRGPTSGGTTHSEKPDRNILAVASLFFASNPTHTDCLARKQAPDNRLLPGIKCLMNWEIFGSTCFNRRQQAM